MNHIKKLFILLFLFSATASLGQINHSKFRFDLTGDANSKLDITSNCFLNKNNPQPLHLNKNFTQKTPLTGDDKMRKQLSSLWVGVTLNMIAADVLTRYIPEAVTTYEEFADGNEANLMLGAALYYQMPITMTVLSGILPYKANRWANIITSGLTAASVIAGGTLEPHYIVFATAEVIMLSAIAWKAIKWKPSNENTQLGLNYNPIHQTFGFNFQHKF